MLYLHCNANRRACSFTFALPLPSPPASPSTSPLPCPLLFLASHLSPCVAVDDGLGDGEGLVQVAEGVQLPVLALHGDVELLDTLQRQLVALDQDAHGLAHELVGHLQDLQGHGGAEQGALHLLGQELEHVVNLLLEAPAQHLVRLVKHEQLHVRQLERAPVDHVVDAAGRAHHHVHAVAQLGDVVAHRRAAHAGVHLHGHEVPQRDQHLHNLLRQLARGRQHQRLALADGGVDGLQDADGERGRLARPCGVGAGVESGVSTRMFKRRVKQAEK